MIEATEFTPLTAALGGALIGLSATLLMLMLGKISGISGLFRSITTSTDKDKNWKVAFFVGMMVAAWLVFNFTSAQFIPRENFPLWQLIAGGLLVGYGTAMGSGCTSGHGVCGIARFSRRSLVATAVFMASGVVTAIIVRHFIGGA
jgi:uncharacterized membrane protein YedE/YeeE